MVEEGRTGIDQDLLAFLVCPIGLAKLEDEGDRLRCTKCGTRYCVGEGGIPNMVVDEAELPADVASYHDLDCWKERGEQ